MIGGKKELGLSCLQQASEILDQSVIMRIVAVQEVSELGNQSL